MKFALSICSNSDSAEVHVQGGAGCWGNCLSSPKQGNREIFRLFGILRDYMRTQRYFFSFYFVTCRVILCTPQHHVAENDHFVLCFRDQVLQTKSFCNTRLA